MSDLNDHLFDALERLSRPGLSKEGLAEEVARAEAIVKVADQITENHRTALGAAKLYAEHGPKIMDFLPKVGQIAAPRAEAGGNGE